MHSVEWDGNMLINNKEVQTWKAAYLKVNLLQCCFCHGYKLWYFHTTQSHKHIITELYIVYSSVQNLCGKLKPTSLKMDSHHFSPNWSWEKHYQVKYFNPPPPPEQSVYWLVPLCAPCGQRKLQSWRASLQQAAAAPLTKYHHGLVALAAVPAAYAASRDAHHSQPATWKVKHVWKHVY
jgi:hypothetical protein